MITRLLRFEKRIHEAAIRRYGPMAGIVLDVFVFLAMCAALAVVCWVVLHYAKTI